MEAKATLRTQIIEQRLALPPGERERLGRLAQAAVIESAAFQHARLILLYQAFRGEVPTDAIAAAAVAAGKGLALPRVQKAPRKLWLHAYSGDPGTLVTGAYGIQEPDSAWPLVDPARVDLVVVPGVGFDLAGNRLGYGGGFYDRTLPEVRAANPGAVLIGLAYALQVVTGGLPKDPHDVPLDGVATENGLLLTSAS